MNIFEQELRRLAKACAGIANPVFAGRACFGDLGGDNRVKLQFITMGYADHYSALKANILNRAEGEVDSLIFRFRDTWGKKYNHGYQDGIPYIWTYQGKSEWYSYHPTDVDIRQLAAEVNGYLDVFTIRAPVREAVQAQPAEKQSVLEQISKAREESKQNPAPRKTAPPKSREPEL